MEPLVRQVMADAAELRVPLEVEVGFGPNWSDASTNPRHERSPGR